MKLPRGQDTHQAVIYTLVFTGHASPFLASYDITSMHDATSPRALLAVFMLIKNAHVSRILPGFARILVSLILDG